MDEEEKKAPKGIMDDGFLGFTFAPPKGIMSHNDTHAPDNNIDIDMMIEEECEPKDIFFQAAPKGITAPLSKRAPKGMDSQPRFARKFDPENVNDLEIIEISGRQGQLTNAGVNGWYHKQREW